MKQFRKHPSQEFLKLLLPYFLEIDIKKNLTFFMALKLKKLSFYFYANINNGIVPDFF